MNNNPCHNCSNDQSIGSCIGCIPRSCDLCIPEDKSYLDQISSDCKCIEWKSKIYYYCEMCINDHGQILLSVIYVMFKYSRFEIKMCFCNNIVSYVCLSHTHICN